MVDSHLERSFWVGVMLLNFVEVISENLEPLLELILRVVGLSEFGDELKELPELRFFRMSEEFVLIKVLSIILHVVGTS